MGDRRKRKSLWDVGEDPRNFSRTKDHDSWSGREPHHNHHDSRRYHNLSASRSYPASNSRENTGQPYWEPTVDESGSRMNDSLLRKEMGGESRYFQNMSPGFDGMDRHKYNQSHEPMGSYSRRKFEKSRSRSRSRSRTRGRSRSRSWSRGRTRERERSRSRSRGHGGAVDQLRSHSPPGQPWKSSSWSDRRSVPTKTPQVGEDFSARRSRKGSWESRDVDDPYRAGDDRPQTRSSHAVTCREFVKGKCRWGDSCRFSHHVASEENFGEVPGRDLSEQEVRDQSYRDTRPFCKFFAAGKCERSNCRFSHDDPKIGSLDGRTVGVIDDKTNDSKSGHGLENGDMNVEIPEWIPGPMGVAGRNVERIGAAGPLIDERIPKKLATPLEFQLQSHNRNRETKVQDNLPEHAFSMDWRQDITPGLLLQPTDHGEAEKAPMGPPQPDVTSEVELKNAARTIIFPSQKADLEVGRVLTQNSAMLNDSSGTQRVYCPNAVHLPHLSMLSQIQNNENAGQMSGILATNTPQLLPCVQLSNAPAAIVGQDMDVVANHSALPMQSFESEIFQKNTATEGTKMFGYSSMIGSTSAQYNPVTTTMENGSGRNNHDHLEQNNLMQNLRSSLLPSAGTGSGSVKSAAIENPELKQENEPAKPESTELNRVKLEKVKQSESHDGLGEDEESVPNKDDKGVRLFKNSLVEAVKDILKPTWKEGKMSREVHKTIVKKVVDKVTSTIQTDYIPKTQDKIDQYLKHSKTKITKLVQAYVGRSQKKDA